MSQLKQKSPEQFVARSPIGKKLFGVFERNLASGALRFVEVNGKPQDHRELNSEEAKIQETLESGYFGIIHLGIIHPNDPKDEFISAEIDNLLITDDDMPESYYELQKRIARERGYGDLEFTDEGKRQTVEMLRADQSGSLTEWSKYLRSNENGHRYPDWFKVYVWESLKRMGEFDKENVKFKKRTASTAAPWPELNAEALAYVYDKVDKGVIGGKQIADERLVTLLDIGSFPALYAYAFHEAIMSKATPELRDNTQGLWVKYDQIGGDYDPYYQQEGDEYIDDMLVNNETAMRLAQSLRGMGTGWCTAGTRTAAYQLSMGDFYVYYTQDDNGDYTIPRIAIRMEDYQVAEVRGIEADQNLEDSMADVVAEKLKTLPGGDEYFEKVENMKRLSEIDNRVKAGGKLNTEDILFVGYGVKGFGWDDDPRARELFNAYFDSVDDLSVVFDEISNKSGHDALAWLLRKAGNINPRNEDYESTSDLVSYLINHVDKLNDDNARFVMVSIIGSRYDELVIENAGKLFSRGMSMFNIFKYMDNMSVRKKAEAVERIVAQLADNGVDEKIVRAAMEVYEVVKSYYSVYDVFLDHMLYTINNLPYDNDTKRLVTWEVIKLPNFLKDRYFDDFLRKIIKLIGRSDKDLTDFVLANELIPFWELKLRKDVIDYYVNIGLDRETLEAYASANNA